MTRNLEVTQEVAAPADVVWQRLAALQDYPHWNSRTRFGRAPQPGRRQIMCVRLFGLWLAVPVAIESCDPARGLRWRGGIPGVFTGSHYFRVESLGAGRSRLIQGEDFDGALVGALWPVMQRELLGLYAAFSHDLRRTCESTGAG